MYTDILIYESYYFLPCKIISKTTKNGRILKYMAEQTIKSSIAIVRWDKMNTYMISICGIIKVSLNFVPKASKTLGIGVMRVFLCYASEAIWLGEYLPGCWMPGWSPERPTRWLRVGTWGQPNLWGGSGD